MTLKAPLILTLDTAGPACQAVISAGQTVLAARSVAMLRGHGEALVPMVEELLDETAVGYEDLDRLAVTTGPGSFTGMRVGIASAKGFSATLNIPVVGVGSLEALAMSDALESKVKAPRAVSIDARNGLIYGQRFDASGAPVDSANVVADLVFSASIIPGTRLVGPATAIIAALARSAGKAVTLGETAAFASPQALAALAAGADEDEKPKPMYLKPADAIAAKPAGLRA